jgi:hypothetical protein
MRALKAATTMAEDPERPTLGIQEREWEDGVREKNEREYRKKNTGN